MATIFPGSASAGQIFDGYSFNGTAWDIVGIDLTADYQPRVANISDTEIGYLNGVTSAIQTQIDSKLSISSASTTYATKTELNNIDLSSASAAAVAAIVDSAPATLDTLNELAAALGDDANYASTITTALGNKLNISTASSTYLTQTSASTIYATQVDLDNIDALPIQTSNDWKFLQTNGASASWSNTLEALYFEFQGVGMDRDVYGYAGLTKSPAGLSFNSYHYTGGIAGGNLNIYAEGTLGLNSPNGITIWSDLNSTGLETGALVVYGGVGISKDVWIDGNLYVNGTTITENAKTVSTHDNLIYLNAALDSTITNAVFASGSITYTAENIYTAGMDIRITGVDPAGFNIATGDNLTVASATSTHFVVVKADPGEYYVSGGTAHAKEEANPDLGFAGGYYDSGYAHAGLFRDASDGTFKFFDGYTLEPDESVYIDTGHASFSLADISASNAYFSGSVSGNWNGSVIPTTKGGTGLTTLGTAGQVIAVNSGGSAIEWANALSSDSDQLIIAAQVFG